MTKRYSFEPLNFLAPLATLLIDLGGDVSQVLNRRSVWFIAEVGGDPAGLAFPGSDVIKPTKNYFLDMAALASEVEKKLLEHGNSHELVPPKQASLTANSARAPVSGAVSRATPESVSLGA